MKQNIDLLLTHIETFSDEEKQTLFNILDAFVSKLPPLRCEINKAEHCRLYCSNLLYNNRTKPIYRPFYVPAENTNRAF
ncbi:hypothetical protein C4F50_15845 [Flavobacterium sp. KB82]|uniref:Uncharacterized protein n=1 Tax=Flavobacterium hungaricum TaxID=2082725 RepID=A0ABR9TNL5_9FLAO|nr:hypothetical protein [Flavobacterium hungaricum]